MSTMKLRDAICKFQVLSDGAQDWEPENLIEVLEENEDPEEAKELGYVLLDDEVYVDDLGIRTIRADGYLGRVIYWVKNPQ
jgi:hypothetical protein